MLILISCGNPKPQGVQSADYYNTLSYELRYSNIDSSYNAAKKAYILSSNYDDERIEALNNLAYIYYQQMKYDHSIRLLKKVIKHSRNQIELLCADVMMMKVMQRIGNGYEFFKCRNRALNRLSRINENETGLTERQLQRVYYATTELHIVSSTYYYYLGQDSLANSEISLISDQIKLDKDTTQYLYYHYMLGSGGLLKGSLMDTRLQEFDHLLLTYTLSKSNNITYFEANSLQSLAEMFIDSTCVNVIKQYRKDAYNYIENQFIVSQEVSGNDSDLPMKLAERSLQLFINYKDLFQTACLYRTIGDIYFANANYEKAHSSYCKALSLVHSQEKRSSKTIVAWMAGIHERLSMSYSSIGNKSLSDYHRNIYLDLLDDSRQNKELDIRMENLSNEVRDIHFGIGVLVVLMMIIITLIIVYIYRIKHHISNQYSTLLNINDSDSYIDACNQVAQFEENQENLKDSLTDDCNISTLHIEEYQNDNIVRRAKVSLVYAIVPYLNRILAETNRMKSEGKASIFRLTYIRELITEITRINDVLTEWIKMQKGLLNLHVSTFPLSNILNILKLNKSTFEKKNISLVVPTTDLKVKADEALTMFMVNTLADNARKFTNPGGKIEIALAPTEEYVEISVTDTGIGLSKDDVEILENSNVYDSSHLGLSNDNKGFGFGIMNCKGIINKYKKISSKFAVCDFGVESEVGKGSRFWFRLPRALCVVLSFMISLSVFAKTKSYSSLFDSTYVANVEGRFEDALRYADSALRIPEVQLDTIMVVQLRNEMAIASQALNRWDDYRYNNNECVRLHWLYSQDTSLSSYCKQMEEARFNGSTLLVLLVIAGLIVLCMLYIIFLKDRIRNRKMISALSERFSFTLDGYKNHIHNLQETFNNPKADIIKQNEQYIQYLIKDQSSVGSSVNADASLTNLVNDFYSGLLNPLRQINELQSKISSLSEQYDKTRFEEDRLYVMNQVLDNSLSTIKHETMYYPARIDQMTQTMQENGDTAESINELHELVTYYKQLYLLLYEQANRQLTQSGFHNNIVSCSEIVQYVQDRINTIQTKEGRNISFQVNDSDVSVRCDKNQLRMLIGQLFKANGDYMEGLFLSFEPGNGVVSISFTFTGINKDQEELDNLFNPSKDHFSYYIIRQIIREHDARYGYPGLRLNATQSENGFTIQFSLPSR